MVSRSLLIKVEPRFKINDKVIHKETGKLWTIHWYLADTNSYYVIDEEELIHHYSEDVLESAEQNPAWSEDDEKMLNTVIHNLRYPGVNYYKKPIEEKVKWLKSLKDRIQPKQEWDEKDKCMLNNVIDTLKPLSQTTHSGYAINSMIDWLKSLKERYTWKPSDGQIMVLRWVLNHIPYDSHKEEISGLLEQLKKLREE